VFRRLQNTRRGNGADATCRGSLFQTQAAATRKVGHQQSTIVYGGRSVMMTMLSEDDLKPGAQITYGYD